MSESVEMYLVMTALLRSAPDQPVPLSLLANKLGVSLVSANEMCHRLEERGLLAYQPYKGVTLTPDGEEWAQRILSRRRLWVIFLVENLGIEPEEADTLACQLEHITSDRLVAALKAFLERDPDARAATGQAPQPLSACTAGTRGVIAAVDAEPTAAAFLTRQGVVPGAEAEVLAVGADGAVLIQVNDHQVALASALARRIFLDASAVAHTARHAAWRRCSAFWSCVRGEPHICPMEESLQQVATTPAIP
ncbi:MAG: FeoA domain-containing protein [Roseiflexus sp.]|nr:FeoA domain-containing protein [Roseiflexus sp.]MCS7289839.1 FeoA domain-containing protein [Roseiflexus sp.]MDW8146924.1 iron dependent repressor, metal binding and dimerization domain protein [Roseiflexaceae bacterium]MDW8232567.1 iron dependent repressor, metal binding and dimerization domain protein [Roseiflexaceae bacterium]